jgi:uncharacterized membrane-anchored protein YitT (DUF2179 family)
VPTSTFRRAATRTTPELLNIILIVLGVLSANMGLHGFLLSSNFIDGGVTGVSMLVSKVSGTTLSVWLPVFNLPFIALGYRQIGGGFALRSALAIAGLSLAVAPCSAGSSSARASASPSAAAPSSTARRSPRC